MLVSMTGYGRSKVKTPIGDILIEIQSQNRKFLETHIFNLPDNLFCLEIPIKNEVASRISRGQILVRLTIDRSAEKLEESLPPLSLLQDLKDVWIDRSKKLGFDPKAIDLHFLLQSLGGKKIEQKIEDLEEMKEKLFSSLKKSLDLLIKMKNEEGGRLQKDIEKRLKDILSLIKKVEKIAKEAPSHYQEKLTKRIEEYLTPITEKDDRILKEVVLFADKIDITEELVRLSSHINYFLTLIKSKESPLGKKLDFLTQEIGREINTIGSKSSDVEIAKNVVQVKAELEKIKEQLQNIE